MKEFQEVLERLHPDDDTIVRSALLLVGHHGWVVQYDVGADMTPWLMHCVGGIVQWAHTVDYDVTQFPMTKVETDHSVPQGFRKAHPYVTDENIGSCEPSSLIQWDKTQKTWHVDVGKVGRYSVRRTQPRGPYAAYLNNNRIENVGEDADASVIKKRVETRIHEARRINRETV